VAQEGTSLSAVAYSTSSTGYTGSAVTPSNPYANASMVLSAANYTGPGVVQVALQASHDGTNWVTAGAATVGGGQPYVNVPGVPGVQLRAVITSFPSNCGASCTVTATVCGV
jgi:hypothetical protein